MPKADKKGRKKGSGKELRDLSIRAAAMSGEKTKDIADKYGVTRQTVSEILNSAETKKLVALGDTRLKLLMTEAIDTLEFAMQARAEFGCLGGAIKAAITVLKNMGLARDSVDVNHSFPKPTVIKRRDGTEVVLGTIEDDEGAN